MKLRTSFVSNSSSSSYLVIETTGLNVTDRIKEEEFQWSSPKHFIPNKEYKYEFGWEEEQTHNFWDKLNFIGIQLMDILTEKLNTQSGHNRYIDQAEVHEHEDTFDYYVDMLKKVCKEKFNLTVELNDDLLGVYLSKDYKPTLHLCDAYIDHQSSVVEGKNMEMFKDEETLYNFLAYESSYIQGGNDN